MSELKYADFSKFDIRIGKILSATEIPKTRNLVEFIVDIGTGQPINIIETFANKINIDEVEQKKILVITNLPPRKLMGYESQGIILAAEFKGKISLPILDDNIPPGTKIR